MAKQKFGKRPDGTYTVDDTFPFEPEYWERRNKPVPEKWRPIVNKEIARRKRVETKKEKVKK